MIQQRVAGEWGVTVEGLQSKTRTKNLTVPRQVALKRGGMYVIADHSGRAGTGISESGTLHLSQNSPPIIPAHAATATRVAIATRVRVCIFQDSPSIVALSSRA